MSLGIWQIVLILVIVLIIFGAGKLPQVMGDIAKGVKNFRAGMREEDEGARQQEPKALKSESATTVDQAVKNDETAKT